MTPEVAVVAIQTQQVSLTTELPGVRGAIEWRKFDRKSMA